MPSLVTTTGFNQKYQNKMMLYLDNEEWVDDDNLSFSEDSYNAEEEQEDQDEEVSVYSEKKNARQPGTSHLRLPVLVNGEEVSESDASVGEVRGETLTEVPWDVRVRILTIRFRSISKYYQRQKNLEPRRLLQPVVGLRSRKRVSPTTSLSTWAKDSTKKPTKKKKMEANPKFET
jgi:hypothetical protein